MTKPPLLLILLLLCLGRLPAQDFDHFEPLRSKGQIPAAILLRSSEKFEQDRDVLAKQGTADERASREDFLLQSHFALDEILLSGRVLYNDPVGQYLNRIKDYILRDRPGARDSIRIYAVKSPAVNAFCTNQGVVLVHMGLLSKVKNEAQLAYILCHEFQHFFQQHPITRFVADEKRRSEVQIKSFDDYEEYMLAKNRYSREQEIDADLRGIDLFLKTGYDPAELDGVFDVMRYAYLPFANRDWDNRFFESERFWLPPGIRPDTFTAISAPEDYDDSELSHPNIATRRAAVAAKVAEVRQGGAQYILGETDFRDIQKLCRFDIARQHLDAQSYEQAIYHSFLLLEEHPRSFYLKKNIAQSLYALVKYKNERLFHTVHSDHEEVEGNAQGLYFLSEKLEKEELHALALNFIWRLHLEHAEDVALAEMGEDLLKDYFELHSEYAGRMRKEASHGDREAFLKAAVEEHRLSLADTAAVAGEEVEADSTVEDGALLSRTVTRLVEDQPDAAYGIDLLATNRQGDNYFLLNAFVDLFADSGFSDLYERMQGEAAEGRSRSNVAKEEEKWGWYAIDGLGEVNVSEPSALGGGKVLFISPMVMDYDERKSKAEGLLSSEDAEDSFYGLLEEVAGQVGLDYAVLSASNMDDADMERFNDMVVLRQWVAGEMSRGVKRKMINVYQEEAERVMAKYGADYLALTAALNFTEEHNGLGFYSTMMLLPIVPITPLLLYRMFKKRSFFWYMNWVWDVEEGKMAMKESRYIKRAARKGTVKSSLYYSFIQILSQP